MGPTKDSLVILLTINVNDLIYNQTYLNTRKLINN